MRAIAVSVEGPHSRLNRDGDEVPYWTVCIVDNDHEPMGAIYEVGSRGRAQTLGVRMARDRRLELVDDSSPT